MPTYLSISVLSKRKQKKKNAVKLHPLISVAGAMAAMYWYKYWYILLQIWYCWGSFTIKDQAIWLHA